MKDHPTSPHHDINGQFKRGHKVRAGTGKKPPRKPPVALTALRRVASQQQLDKIVRRLVGDALKPGPEWSSSREWVASRLIPPLRASHAPIQFDFDSTSLDSAARSCLEAIASGTIAADVGESILRSLNATAQIGHMQSLAQRLANLEDKLLNQSGRDLPPTPVITHIEQEDAPDIPDTPEKPLHWRSVAKEV